MAKKRISRKRQIADAIFIIIIGLCVVLILVYLINGVMALSGEAEVTATPPSGSVPATTAIETVRERLGPPPTAVPACI